MKDPYGDGPKKCHMAHLWDQRGRVSALCFGKPRPITLSRETWTIRPEAVTCKRCLAKLAEQAAIESNPQPQVK